MRTTTTFSPSEIAGALAAHGIRYIQRGSEFLVACPFHPRLVGKQDTDPSLHLTLDGTKAHCFSCGWHGSWRKIAKEIGANPGSGDYDAAPVVEALQKQVVKNGIKIAGLPSGIRPWVGEWRGLPEEFVSKLGFQWYDGKYKVDRVLFPDYQQDRLIWVAGCANNADRKRLGNKGKWRNMTGMNSAECFFGESICHGRFVTLVEGPFDALRLIHNNIPALAILGTHNWNEGKAQRLAAMGVDRVLILTDEDSAGKKCRVEIKELAANLFDTISLRLPDGDDPGETSQGMIDKIKARLRKMGWLNGKAIDIPNNTRPSVAKRHRQSVMGLL